jgi:hypothetical protein
MPVTYKLDPVAEVVETRCTGGATLDEVLAHFRELEADPSLPEKLHVLLDLAEMTSLPDRDQLKQVTRAVDQLSDRLRWGACAIVASRDALYGMSRMFEVFAEGLFAQTHVFRSREEAERWLAGAVARAHR